MDIRAQRTRVCAWLLYWRRDRVSLCGSGKEGIDTLEQTLAQEEEGPEGQALRSGRIPSCAVWSLGSAVGR